MTNYPLYQMYIWGKETWLDIDQICEYVSEDLVSINFGQQVIDEENAPLRPITDLDMLTIITKTRDYDEVSTVPHNS